MQSLRWTGDDKISFNAALCPFTTPRIPVTAHALTLHSKSPDRFDPMIRVQSSIFVLILALTACRSDKDKSEEDKFWVVSSYDTTKTAVIVWDKRSHYPFDSLEYRAGTLTREEVEQIEIHLVESVTEYNNSLTDGHEDYKIDLKAKKYKKQLVPVVNSKGEKEVWVNCFCDDWEKAWRNQIVMVQDGGPCYFSFKLNLTTKKVYDLTVNGFA